MWTIADDEVYGYEGNPLGQVVQSVLVHEDKLYVVVNVPGSIQVFDIHEDGLTLVDYIDTQYSGRGSYCWRLYVFYKLVYG